MPINFLCIASKARSQCLGIALATPMLTLTLLSGCTSGPASLPLASPPQSSGSSEVDASVDQRFLQWVARFRESALSEGISQDTLEAAFNGVHLRAQAIQLDRSQPEFTRPIWDYLDTIVSEQRIATGRQKRSQYQREADAASARFGVPGEILMAVWGIESNYGSNFGDVPVIDALATLGFEGRREKWARSELLASLKIIQRGDIERAHMLGSWAGAMGQTQFLPTTYLAYAIDADGDGHPDIWGSIADVLASTANFLARSGWRGNEPCSVEVQLPQDFDLAHADPATRQDSSQWQTEGVRSMDGKQLPALSSASILLPAGSHGPAFLIGQNFGTLLRYNNSNSYALAVCLLAQRISGGLAVQGHWPRNLRTLTRNEMLALQTALNQRGFDSGQPDGLMGPATRHALRQFQRSLGLAADGYPTDELLRLLQADR